MSKTTAVNRLAAAQDRLDEMKGALAADLSIAVANGEHFDSERIAKAANAIAAQEGAVRIRAVLASLEINDASPEVIQRAMMREALRGPDDQWSGRANDVRRAFADGCLQTIDEAMQHYS